MGDWDTVAPGQRPLSRIEEKEEGQGQRRREIGLKTVGAREKPTE